MSGRIGSEKVDKNGKGKLEISRPKEFDEFGAALHPRDMRVFFDAYDPDAPRIGLAEKLGGLFLRIPEVRNALPAGHFREWPEIDAWVAEGIKRALVPARDSVGVPT